MRNLAKVLLLGSSLSLFLMVVSFYALPQFFELFRIVSLCGMVGSISVLRFLGYPLYGSEKRWAYSNSLVVCALILFSLGFAKLGVLINGMVIVVLAATFIGASWNCIRLLNKEEGASS